MFQFSMSLGGVGHRAKALFVPRALLFLLALVPGGAPASAAETGTETEARIEALIPRLDAVVAQGMAAFGDPGVAVGIVAGDRLVYARGFGVRREGGAPVDPRTVFQIGSVSKSFLATTMAIAVDRGKLSWDDRIVDLDPGFQMMDPWVTREFRLFDILAQRSGLPMYVNDTLGFLGFDEAAMIRSLRHVEPASSFRSEFTYTNITHLEAGRIVATAGGAPDWESVLRREILEPLGMRETSFTAEAIEVAPNHATGHVWTPEGLTEAPFTPLFPYAFGGAGAINSNVEDMARWLRLQIGDGEFEGERIVSAENLGVTRTARVGVSDRLAYAMGWILHATPNGTVVFHGGATTFGSYAGFAPDADVGVVVLSNGQNRGLPHAIGEWAIDKLLGNPEVDHVARTLAGASAGAERDADRWRRPAAPRPAPPLAPLAGEFSNPVFGKVSLREDGEGLRMAFPTGAALVLTPWNGEIFTAALAPEGTYAAVAVNLGPNPLYFAQFEVDATGGLGVLRLTDERQSYAFTRD